MDASSLRRQDPAGNVPGQAKSMPYRTLPYLVVLVLSSLLLTGLGEIVETVGNDELLAWKWHRFAGIPGLSACLPFQLLQMLWALSGLLLCSCPLWSGWYRTHHLAITVSSILAGWVLEALYLMQTGDALPYMVFRALAVPLLVASCLSLPPWLRLLSHGVGLSLGVAAVCARPDAITVSAGICTALVVAHTSGALLPLLARTGIGTAPESITGKGPVREAAREKEDLKAGALGDSGERHENRFLAYNRTSNTDVGLKDGRGDFSKISGTLFDDVADGGGNKSGVFGQGWPVGFASDPQSRELERWESALEFATGDRLSQELSGEENETEEEEGDDFEERIMEQAAAPGAVRDSSETIFIGRPNASAALIGTAPDPAIAALLRNRAEPAVGGSRSTGEPPPAGAETARLRARGSLVLTNEERMATTTSRLIALAGAASGKLSRGGVQTGVRGPPARREMHVGAQEPASRAGPSLTPVVRASGDAPALSRRISGSRLAPVGGTGPIQVSVLPAQGESGLATQGGSGLARPSVEPGGSGLSLTPVSRKGKKKVVEAESTAKPTARPTGLRVLPGVSEREREALSATYAAVSAARAAEALGAARPWGTGAGLPTTELDYRAGGEGNWQSPRWSGLCSEGMSWMQEMEFMGPGWDGGISRTDDEKVLGRGVVSGAIEGGGNEEEEEESDEDEDYDFAKMEEKYAGLLGNRRGFAGRGFGADVSKGAGAVSRGSGSCVVSKGAGPVSKDCKDVTKGSADVGRGTGDFSKGAGDIGRSFSDVSRGYKDGLNLSETAALGPWGSGLGFAAAILDDSDAGSDEESDDDVNDFSDEDDGDGWDEGQGLGEFATAGSYPVPDPNPAINPWGLYPEQQKQWLDAIARGTLPMPSGEKAATGLFPPSAGAVRGADVKTITAPRFVLDASSPVLKVEPPLGEGPSRSVLEKGLPSGALQPLAGTGFYPSTDSSLRALSPFGAEPPNPFKVHTVEPEGVLFSRVDKPRGQVTVMPAAVRFDPVEELEERLLGPTAAADVNTCLSTSERITQLLSAPAFTLDASVPAASAPAPIPANANTGAFSREDLLAASHRITQMLAAPIFTLDASVATVPVSPSGSNRGGNSGAKGGELPNPSRFADRPTAETSSNSVASSRLEPEPVPSFKPCATTPPVALPIAGTTPGETNRAYPSRFPTGELVTPAFAPLSAEPLRPTVPSSLLTVTPPPNSTIAAGLRSGVTLRSGKSYPSPGKPAPLNGQSAGSAAMPGLADNGAGGQERWPLAAGRPGNGQRDVSGGGDGLSSETFASFAGAPVFTLDARRPAAGLGDGGVSLFVPTFTLDASKPAMGLSSGAVPNSAPAFTLDASRPATGLSVGGVSDFTPAFTLDANRPLGEVGGNGVARPAFTLEASRPAVGPSSGGVSDFIPAFTLDASKPVTGFSRGSVSDFIPAFTLDARRPAVGHSSPGVSDFTPAFTLDASRPVVGPNSGGVSGISLLVNARANRPAGTFVAPSFTLDASRPAVQTGSSFGASKVAPSFSLDASKGVGALDVGNAAPSIGLDVRVGGTSDKTKTDGYAWTQMTERLARRSNGRGMSKVDQEWLKVMERVKDKMPQMQVEWKPELHIPFDALGN